MTLEQYSYIAQIVASVGVVASLIYVAQRLVQNTRMMRASVSNDRVQRDFDLSGAVFKDWDFAEGQLAITDRSKADRRAPRRVGAEMTQYDYICLLSTVRSEAAGH